MIFFLITPVNVLAWGKVILKFTEKRLLFSEKRLFEVTVYFHEKVFRSNCLKPDILREEQSKINAIETKSQFSQFVEKIYICNQFYLNQLVLWFCFKCKSHRRFKFKNVQSLITMGKDRSFGNIFWSCNFRVFDIMEFVTFRKS